MTESFVVEDAALPIGDRDDLRDRQEVAGGHRDLPSEILPVQGLEQARAQPARRQHVHMLEPLELLARETVADRGMVRPHHAGEAVVHEMLDDQIVRRIEDATQNHGRRAGYDAGLDQVVAVRREAKPDTGGHGAEAGDDHRRQHELGVTVRRDGQPPLGPGRIEVLLAEHHVVDPRQRVGDHRREFERGRRGLDPVARADEELILHGRPQPRQRVRERRLRQPQTPGRAGDAALLHERDEDRQQVEIVAHGLCHRMNI